VSLVWSVPVVAAAVAAGMVLASTRPLAIAAGQLAREVARLGELRAGLAALRDAARDTDGRVAAFRSRHAAAAESGLNGTSRRGTAAGGDGPPPDDRSER
jgi:hypothetical protein